MCGREMERRGVRVRERKREEGSVCEGEKQRGGKRRQDHSELKLAGARVCLLLGILRLGKLRPNGSEFRTRDRMFRVQGLKVRGSCSTDQGFGCRMRRRQTCKRALQPSTPKHTSQRFNVASTLTLFRTLSVPSPSPLFHNL